VIYGFIVGALRFASSFVVFLCVVTLRLACALLGRVFDGAIETFTEPSRGASAEMQHHEREGYKRWLDHRSKDP